MKAGILGSGGVGHALAAGLLKYGHEVMLGTRNIEAHKAWAEENKARVGSFAEAAAFGDMVFLAVKGTAAKAALQLAGGEHLQGKTVVDATNPIADSPPENGVLHFFTSMDRSLMEELQSEFPGANFVKAFSSIGSALMVNPDFGGTKPTMFICGNDDAAKKQVTTLLDQFGFEPEDMGGAEAARAIEPLCILWCIPGFRGNQWNHAFKLLKGA